MRKDFRFGVGLRAVRSLREWTESARRCEDLGYDVLNVPDHLGAIAPFPALAAAAAVTNRIRLGTFVLNACFYKPALLARDAADLAILSDGRLDLGLGAGYVAEEFTAAELPFPPAGARVDYLEHVADHLRRELPELPLLIAGNGPRVLTVAARHAQLIGLTGSDEAPGLAGRIGWVREAAGDRFDDLVLNLAITAVPTDSSGLANLSLTRRFSPGRTDEQLLAMPSVLSGSPAEMADTLRGYRDRYGLTYFTVQGEHAAAFAPVIEILR